jgi:hypothetical protein
MLAGSVDRHNTILLDDASQRCDRQLPPRKDYKKKYLERMKKNQKPKPKKPMMHKPTCCL